MTALLVILVAISVMFLAGWLVGRLLPNRPAHALRRARERDRFAEQVTRALEGP